MECPFELPVKKKPDFDFNKTGLYRIEDSKGLFVSFSLKEDEVDYIVQAINSYVPREESENAAMELEKAAKKCTRTGDRKDLQEYLKLRRNYL